LFVPGFALTAKLYTPLKTGIPIVTIKGYIKQQFSVSKVVLVEGIPSGDLTRELIGGFSRFIDPSVTLICWQGQNAPPWWLW
jgi:hypothetical protein